MKLNLIAVLRFIVLVFSLPNFGLGVVVHNFWVTIYFFVDYSVFPLFYLDFLKFFLFFLFKNSSKLFKETILHFFFWFFRKHLLFSVFLVSFFNHSSLSFFSLIKFCIINIFIFYFLCII